MIHSCNKQGNIRQREIPEEKRMQWWEEGQFGMFLHWGVYSTFGGEWQGKDFGKEMGGASAEWIYLMADIPKSEYEYAARKFNPLSFDAKQYVGIAKKAGMRYMVLTAKHHDGFALFNSEASEWNIFDASDFKRDIIKEYTDECHRQGMRVGLYYSHEKDWYNRNKVRIDTTQITPEYMQIVKIQLEELLTKYGKIDLMWFDMGINQHREMNQMCYDLVRRLQPECIINSRIGNGLGDYEVLNDRQIIEHGREGYVESIMTMRLNWGYDKNDINWKSSKEVISMLSKCICRGSNFLLNVGPDGDGSFTLEETERLIEIGNWMEINGEAVYDNSGSPFTGEYPWGSVSVKRNQMYLHLYGEFGDKIKANGIKTGLKNIRMLGNGIELKYIQDRQKAELEIELPPDIHDILVPVLVLEFNGKLRVKTQAGPSWIPPTDKYFEREQIEGKIAGTAKNNLKILSGNKELNFRLHDEIEFRKNTNGNIFIVKPYNLKMGESCNLVYTPEKDNRIEIISMEDNPHHVSDGID
jgi:alpha-L-fucosidase